MQIGAVIRKHRLEQSLTQEQLAKRLGVTAPAVNKWEKGNSMPDITLLSPIARLLNISLDTLLSHTAALANEEAGRLVETAHERLQAQPFEAVLCWAKQQLQAYPNSGFLALYMARILQSHLQMQQPEEEQQHEAFFLDCYQRALESEDEGVKTNAADALYHHYMAKDEFEKAEEYLDCFSKENPERKRKQAAIHWETGRTDEAMRMYEELLYAGYQSISLTFQDICYCAMKGEDYTKARQMVQKLESLALLFEMGEYHEASAGLELAIVQQDADWLLAILQRLLGNVESISAFTKSPLYAHMVLKQPSQDYYDHVRQSLLECLDEEACAFIQADPRFVALRGQALQNT